MVEQLSLEQKCVPTLGETRKAWQIRRKGRRLFVWQACSVCGKQRWVGIIHQRPSKDKCPRCAHLEHHHSHETKEKMSQAHMG